MKLLLAVRAVEGKYEGAFVVDGRFQRSATADSPDLLVERFLFPAIAAITNSDAEFVFDVEVTSPAERTAAEARRGPVAQG